MQEDKKVIVGQDVLDFSRPLVMTILNVTPDSFWEESRYSTDEQITKAVDDAVENGAAIIDVGGYSSRPGASDIPAEEELQRVRKGLKIIRERHPHIVVSIDTFRSYVAGSCIREFGQCIINDISGGDLDPRMIATAAELGVPFIATHMKGDHANMHKCTDYDDVTDDVKHFFARKIKELNDAGVKDVILDPGFGFSKTIQQNYQLLNRIDEFGEFGHPVLVGVSRKSMIYKVLGVEPREALTGTIAINWEGLRKGASILRVHDTRQAADIIKLNEYYTKAYES